jgi:branched-chain amino acid transport system permease protein
LLIGTLIYWILRAEFMGSITLMIAVVAAILLLDRFDVVNSLFSAYIANKMPAIVSAIAVCIVVPLLLGTNNYLMHITTMAVIYAMACLGLNFQMGSTDMVNFAPAAFMGIGAYSVAVCTVRFSLSPWVGLLLGIVLSAIFGIIIGLPTLRTKGYYLSLVTLAMQIAFTQLLFNIPFLGGANGLPGVSRYSIFDFSLYSRYTIFGQRYAPQFPYLMLCICILILLTYISMRIYFSRSGLSLNVIAQDPIAANCLGINVSRQKLFAFVIGGIFCGISGSLLAGLESYAGPDNYDFTRSLMLICMVILGGMDNSIGVISGAFLLTIISEKLRDFADFQQFVFGAILIVMLIVRPSGLIPKRKRDYCRTSKRTLSLTDTE